MATYDYEKTKQQYESLNDQQKQQFANMKGGYVQDFLTQYNAEKSKASTPTTTTTQTQKTDNYGYPTEYQGTGTNKANSYKNQGAGNYSYSDKSEYYEKQTTPEAPKTTSMSSTQKAWDDLSYADQQKKMSEIPGLREAITKKGWNIKSETPTTPTTPETPTAEETPKQGEWDYQDNSPERMAQMADNVNKIYATNPGIFENEDTFKKFFIDGKGRTPEQEAFLMDFYKNRKKYNELDNYTADEIGAMDVHGYVPESYLTYLKNSDPERYAAVMDARAKEQSKIEDKSEMDSILNMLGEADDKQTTRGKMIEWAKREGLLVDENGDLIDDRRYHEATEEEKTYAKEYSDNLARIMELQQTKRDVYDNYVKAYPGATKATLLALTNDATAEIQKEIDNLTVENTRLQGYISYAQSERQAQDQAGADTITQLEKALGMYYTHSPEGMSELAQAQYAATNVTLDQADNGTDTQKQMALDSVLTDYFDKYGSIIQRSKSQVINDVMKLAKDKGISLSEALQENFITPLQSKPEYAQMNTDTSGISWGKIGEDADGNAVYGFIDLYNKTVTPYGNAVSNGAIGNYDTSTRGGKASTIKDIVSYDGTEDLGSVVSDIYNKFNGQNYGECGYLVNDYYKAVTGDTKNLITGTFDDRKGMFTKNTPSAGDIVLFDWNGSPTASDKMKTYGHVALVESTDATGMWIVDANWDGNGTVDRRHINYTDDLYKNRVYGFYEIPEDKKQSTTNLGTGNYGADAISAFEEFNKLGSKGLDTKAKQERAKELFELLGTDENGFKIMANGYWDSENAKQAQANIDMIDQLIADIDNLPSIRMRDRLGTPNSYGAWRNQSDGGYGFSSNVMKELWMDEEDLADYNRWASNYDELMANLMYDKYQDIKSTGGTFGSMSNAEWDNLKQAATNLKFNQDATTYYNNLIKLRKQFEHLASYGNNNKSVLTPQKQNTQSALMSKFTSY